MERLPWDQHMQLADLSRMSRSRGGARSRQGPATQVSMSAAAPARGGKARKPKTMQVRCPHLSLHKAVVDAGGWYKVRQGPRAVEIAISQLTSHHSTRFGRSSHAPTGTTRT